MGDGIIQAFRPDEEIRILDVDHARSILTAATGACARATLPYPGLAVVRSTLQEGRRLRVRYGIVSSDEERHARDRSIRRGAPKIAAMGHLAPTVTASALAVLRWSLGDSACADLLRRVAEEASTDQEVAEYTHGAGRTAVRLDLRNGHVRASADLPGARIAGDELHLEIALPAIVAIAAPGRRVRDVVDHPALAGVVTRVSAAPGGGSVLHLAPCALGVAEAISSIERPALAA